MNILYLAGWGIIGWLCGGGVNYLADQMPGDAGLRRPYCTSCGTETHPWKYYILLSRCGSCQYKRTLRSWFVQFGLLLIAIALNILPDSRLPVWTSVLLFTYIILVATIDIEHRLILGSLSMAGLIIGAGVGLYLHSIVPTILGGVAGAGVMLLLYWLGRLFSRWMTKRREEPVDEEALGFGDVYVAAIIGLLLGWPGITAGLFLAIVTGGLVSGLYLLGMTIFKRYQPFTALPYAPFLLLAAVALLYR